MNDLLMLRADDVRRALSGREKAVLHAIRDAYLLHERRMTVVPHSSFVPLPGETGRRIIALPAYVGSDVERAGIKWIASFPENVQRGLERASAVIVLNSMATGRPEVIMEGARISAVRTAASAAVAARALQPDTAWREMGLVGCGVINLHIVRYLLAAGVALEHVCVYDLDRQRADAFAAGCARAFPRLRVVVAGNIDAVLSTQRLVSLATSATQPHIMSLDASPPGSLILHLSLRDIAPKAIARCDNVVDDAGHVCRAQTSLHLAELWHGTRDFIRTSIGEVLSGAVEARADDDSVTVFSPFGLGVLDIAVAALVNEAALDAGLGTRIEGFFAPEAGAEAPRASDEGEGQGDAGARRDREEVIAP
jgi:ornithine cyclodeaminase